MKAPPLALNPNHPVTQELETQWHKILGAVMLKVAPGKAIILNKQDIAKINDVCLIAHVEGDTITLRHVSPEVGREIAKKEGGLPV